MSNIKKVLSKECDTDCFDKYSLAHAIQFTGTEQNIAEIISFIKVFVPKEDCESGRSGIAKNLMNGRYFIFENGDILDLDINDWIAREDNLEVFSKDEFKNNFYSEEEVKTLFKKSKKEKIKWLKKQLEDLESSDPFKEIN